MRSNELLDTFEKKTFLTLEDISQELGVSLRTAQNELNLIRDSSESFSVDYSELLGYFITINNLELYKEYRNKQAKSVELSSEDRRRVLLGVLLLNLDFVTVLNLSKEVQASESQIRKDLNSIEAQLDKRKFKLVRKAHFGFRIRANFSDRMHELVRLKRASNKIVTSVLGLSISPDLEKRLRNNLICLANKQRWTIDDHQFTTVMDWIAILIKLKAQPRKCEESHSSKMLSQVLKDEELLKDLPEESYGWFEEVVPAILKASSNYISYQDVYKVIEEFFSNQVIETLRSLRTDDEFVRLLALHIVFMIDRLNKKIHVWNPYAKRLSQTYPVAFAQALLLAKNIRGKFNIEANVEEIALLTMHMVNAIDKSKAYQKESVYHIGVVCPLGGGASEWIRRHLYKIFERAEIKTFALAQFEELKEFQPDLVFSVSSVDHEITCPVIELDDDNISFFDNGNADNFLEKMVCRPRFPNFWELFSPQHFRVLEKCLDYRQFLLERATEMEEEQSQKGYRESLLEREDYLSTIYENGIAIPHPLEMKGNKNIIDVTILPKGIENKGSETIIVFMIGLKANQIEIHQMISKYLVRLSQNIYSVEKLSKAKNYKEFMYVLKHILKK